MTDAPTPPVVVFDFGGVVCEWLPDRRLAALAALCGLPPATIDQLVFESGFDDAGERGQFSPAAFTSELMRLLGLADSAETRAQLRSAWAQAFEPVPALVRVIEAFPGHTALFTNNGPLLEGALAHELAVAGSAFSELLFSWRIGATKPDPAAFAGATEQLGVAAGSITFFDDSQANVDAARAFGWQAHLFTTVLDVQAHLHALRTR